MAKLLRFVALLLVPTLTSTLQILPPVFNSKTTADHDAYWNAQSSQKMIYIEAALASNRDQDGLTLIPPSGYDFASIFQQDINAITNSDWTITVVDTLPINSSGILLGLSTGDSSNLTYENDSPTSEAYHLDISTNSVHISSTGSRGMFWGTRTLLQHLLIGNNTNAPVSSVTDVPAYATRGYMLDAGRKWYSRQFLKDLCTYASFFKMNEFHYHLSDNYPLNRGRNESWNLVYSHFSLLPEVDEPLRGILHGRENETLSRREFADLQMHCAKRGVTIIPEIEAPGHCLYLTKWKPEIALERKRDLLNLTHPETIPTVKRIWDEFLPWFATKEVHIGADEYEADLADDYIGFVNDMNGFMREKWGKRVRIWGTYEPSKRNQTIDGDVIVQHWQKGQSDPLELVGDDAGHEVINSEDRWAYLGVKNDHMPILPAKYPQFFDEEALLGRGRGGGRQWTPAVFGGVDDEEAGVVRLRDGEKRNKGAIMATWNDNGPDASTQLEAYYAMRFGIALVGSRGWSGSRGKELVKREDLRASVEHFSRLAPGQNLERVLSGNNADDGCYLDDELSWTRGDDNQSEEVYLGCGSKGMNYTLSLNVTGSFKLWSEDGELSLSEKGGLMFMTDGYEYPLRRVAADDALRLDQGHPGRIWSNVTSSTHEVVNIEKESRLTSITVMTDVLHGSVVWINGEVAGRFEVFVHGGRNTLFSWSQMAFVAPLERIEGRGLIGLRVSGRTSVQGES